MTCKLSISSPNQWESVPWPEYKCLCIHYIMRHLHPDDFQLTYIYIGSVYAWSFVINWFVNSIQVCDGLKFNLYSLVFGRACMCELGVGEPRANLLRFTLVRLLSRRTLGSANDLGLIFYPALLLEMWRCLMTGGDRSSELIR